MAEMGLFFESVNGDRRYKVVELVAYLRPFFSDGVFPNPSTGLQVMETAEKDMFVTVKVGDAWINGRMYRNLDDKKIRLDPSDSATTRIDRIVVGCNYKDRVITSYVKKGTPASSASAPELTRNDIDPSDSATTRIDRIVVGCNYKDRVITSYVKKGTPASSASAPELTRNDTLYEISLAEITIAPGAVGITQSAIKDTRLDQSKCGIVTALVDTVDTQTLYNQLETWRQEFMQEKDTQMANWIATFQRNMNSWKDTEQQAFVDWFNGIKGQLSGDIAANLTTRVNELEKKINNMKLTADNVSVNTIDGLAGTNVQEILEAMWAEINGQATRLNGINNELSAEIGNPT